MMIAMPERIFAGQTFNGERDWTANGDASGGYAAYTRTDLSEAAIAAAKAEGPRAVEMLRIAASFLRDVEPKGTAFYDGADCDYFCIADDCEAAADDMEAAAGDAP